MHMLSLHIGAEESVQSSQEIHVVTVKRTVNGITAGSKGGAEPQVPLKLDLPNSFPCPCHVQTANTCHGWCASCPAWAMNRNRLQSQEAAHRETRLQHLDVSPPRSCHRTCRSATFRFQISSQLLIQSFSSWPDASVGAVQRHARDAAQLPQEPNGLVMTER